LGETPDQQAAWRVHRLTADLARPLQMGDALSRNTPKLNAGAQILLANCLAHGRRLVSAKVLSAFIPEPEVP
jgi:hypothetical protein